MVGACYRPEDDGLLSVMVEPKAKQERQRWAEAAPEQGQAGQDNASQHSSMEPEGADRVVPSVEHNAEMHHGAEEEPAQPAGHAAADAPQHVRIYPVRWSNIRDALMWLKEHNPAYDM